MIVVAILAIWLVSILPFCAIAYNAGRDDERARNLDRVRVRAAIERGDVRSIR